MNLWQLLENILMAAIPAALVVAAVVVVFRQLHERELARQRQHLREKAFEHLMPLRISAYERITLYLERISLLSLLHRVSPQERSVRDFKQALVADINGEYEHNIVQQLYVSEAAWQRVLAAKSEIISLIDEQAEALGPQAPGLRLAEALLTKLRDAPPTQREEALAQLRQDLGRFLK